MRTAVFASAKLKFFPKKKTKQKRGQQKYPPSATPSATPPDKHKMATAQQSVQTVQTVQTSDEQILKVRQDGLAQTLNSFYLRLNQFVLALKKKFKKDPKIQQKAIAFTTAMQDLDIRRTQMLKAVKEWNKTFLPLKEEVERGSFTCILKTDSALVKDMNLYELYEQAKLQTKRAIMEYVKKISREARNFHQWEVNGEALARQTIQQSSGGGSGGSGGSSEEQKLRSLGLRPKLAASIIGIAESSNDIPTLIRHSQQLERELCAEDIQTLERLQKDGKLEQLFGQNGPMIQQMLSAFS